MVLRVAKKTALVSYAFGLWPRPVVRQVLLPERPWWELPASVLFGRAFSAS